MPLTSSAGFSFVGVKHRKIHQMAIHVDLVHAHANAVAQPKSSFGVTSGQCVRSFVKLVVIVNQRADGHHAFDIKLVQFDVKAKIAHVDDQPVEFLADTFAHKTRFAPFVYFVFGGMKNNSNLLISDAWPIGTPPRLYVQEQHAEDEFTQGPYGSSKFNRPCLVAGTFTFSLVLRERLHGGQAGLAGTALREAQNALALANALGQARMLPLGGGVWRGHGWVKLTLQEQAPADEQGERVTQPAEQINQETNA